jgi:hypothetical protein
MRPLFAYLLIASVGLSAVRCATKRAPIYKQLEERKNRYEQLIEEVNGDFYEEPMRQVGWLLHNS